MDASRMEDLVHANARAARQLVGVPTVPLPSEEEDAAFALRVKAMLRSQFPGAAPPPPVIPRTSTKDVSKGNAGALIMIPGKSATTTSGAASGGAGKPGSHLALTTVRQKDTPTSSILSAGRKRDRDVDGAGASEGGGDEPILSVDPEQLRNRHALVVASAARDATANSTEAGTLSGDADAVASAAPKYTPPRKWKMSKVLVGHQGWVWTAAVDPTNSWFATGGFDAVIKVWDLSTGALKMNLTGHKEAVRGIALSNLSPYMFSCSDDHSIKCWDLERNEVVREFFGHRSAVHCVTAHPSIDVLISGGRDKTVRVWDVRTRAAVHTMDGHTDSVMCATAQQADPQAITGGSDGIIYFWDIGSGRPITRLTRHKKPVRGVVLTQDGSQMVSCGADEIRVWKLPSGDFQCNASTIVDKGKRRAETEEELAYRWSCCAISPRGVLSVASQDGHIGVYDMNRPQSRLSNVPFYSPYQMTKTKPIPGTLAGEGGINSVTYDASGTRMITAESDKSIKIWRLRDE